MRIKKVSQTTPVQAQIVDGYSTSTTDGYSANYINQKTNIISAYRTEDYYITTSNTYEKIPLQSYDSVGNKLTLNSSGEIVVGAGVTAVKTSAKICLVGANLTAGNKNLVIQKNGTVVDRIWARIDTYNSYMAIPPKLITVAEGDVLTLNFYGTQNDRISGTSYFSNFTVEVVK